MTAYEIQLRDWSSDVCSSDLPSEAPWPKEAWGMKLGHRVSHIRHQEIYVKDRKSVV